ncbi:MAG: enoyl-CoA hydratase-related protein [Alphaproteobacteria bacterium]
MSVSEYNLVSSEKIGSVLRVTLDRPKRRNALSEQMVSELLKIFSIAEQDTSTNALILRGSGKSFCSGYDVSFSESDPSVSPSPIEKMQSVIQDNRLFDCVMRSPVPTIAQIHGHCLAAGTDLAFCCDMIICSKDARVGYPAVRSVGVPVTHMWLYHMGPQWAKRLLFTGDSITGEKAAELGLALEAVDPGQLDSYVLELATRISWINRDVLIANKSVINQGLELMGRAMLQETAVARNVLIRFTPAAHRFWETIEKEGVKQAITSRDSQFSSQDPIT